VAGGVGASFLLPFAEELSKRGQAWEGVWCVRSAEAIQWAEHITTPLAPLSIYITGDSSSGTPALPHLPHLLHSSSGSNSASSDELGLSSSLSSSSPSSPIAEKQKDGLPLSDHEKHLTASTAAVTTTSTHNARISLSKPDLRATVLDFAHRAGSGDQGQANGQRQRVAILGKSLSVRALPACLHRLRSSTVDSDTLERLKLTTSVRPSTPRMPRRQCSCPHSVGHCTRT
jgi:hypothetical protein